MKVVIFGLGAIGSNLMVQLVRQFPDWEFVGVDFDKIEERNVRTQAYFIEQVGLLKVQAMRSVLARFRRQIRYTPVAEKLVEPITVWAHKHGDVGLWVDCFDNAESRWLLTPTENKDVNVLHVGFSPHYTAECIWNKDYEVPGDVDPKAGDICSMDEAVGFINFVVSAATMTISKFAKSQVKESWILTGKRQIKTVG